jgi:hypothetical protein
MRAAISTRFYQQNRTLVCLSKAFIWYNLLTLLTFICYPNPFTLLYSVKQSIVSIPADRFSYEEQENEVRVSARYSATGVPLAGFNCGELWLNQGTFSTFLIFVCIFTDLEPNRAGFLSCSIIVSAVLHRMTLDKMLLPSSSRSIFLLYP